MIGQIIQGFAGVKGLKPRLFMRDGQWVYVEDFWEHPASRVKLYCAAGIGKTPEAAYLAAQRATRPWWRFWA